MDYTEIQDAEIEAVRGQLAPPRTLECFSTDTCQVFPAIFMEDYADVQSHTVWKVWRFFPVGVLCIRTDALDM